MKQIKTMRTDRINAAADELYVFGPTLAQEYWDPESNQYSPELYDSVYEFRKDMEEWRITSDEEILGTAAVLKIRARGVENEFKFIIGRDAFPIYIGPEADVEINSLVGKQLKLEKVKGFCDEEEESGWGAILGGSALALLGAATFSAKKKKVEEEVCK